ncbi:MAG: hypothetical protein Q4A12_06475 [Eubacteriales bacterium]|nr:hypothetical protein [Eubacteriales bacterium]
MKKNIICLSLLVISIVAFFLYNQYTRATKDTTAPIIKCSEDTITASVSVTEEELLKGVTAFDETCGDVSDTIVIEKISDFIADNERVITYVAVDDSMNVGRYERTLIYTDYKPPTFTLKAPLSYTVGTKINILKDVGAKSVIDGDVSDKVRYGLEQVIDNLTPGKYPIELRVTDSCGKTSYLNTEIEIYDSSYSGIKVELKKYLTYLPVGTVFNKGAYYKGSNIQGTLSIVSNVNTKVPGTYYADYYVSAENVKGKSRLTVVVY